MGTASCLGVMQRLPRPDGYRLLARIAVRRWNRRFRYRGGRPIRAKTYGSVLHAILMGLADGTFLPMDFMRASLRCLYCTQYHPPR
jgi:hypothetical protein